MDIANASSSADIDAVRALWLEYWGSLGLPEEFQSFSSELHSLPGAYSPPAGALLLARIDGSAAGTAALRPLRGVADACEAKRVYVRAYSRGLGLGRALLRHLLSTARDAGYRAVYADTLASMHEALQMYRSAGFAEIGPYSANPTPNAIYLKLEL